MADPQRTWTIDERIDAFEAKGRIVPPFTPDERALVRAAAEAWHFAKNLTELPGRCPEKSQELVSVDLGIVTVLRRRRNGGDDERQG